MIVRVATSTGRGVLDVAHDSFALTRWMFWHLERADHRARIQERRDRFDLAGLISVARGEPKKFADMMTDYDRECTEPAVDPEVRTARALSHIEAHKRMHLTSAEGGSGR